LAWSGPWSDEAAKRAGASDWFNLTIVMGYSSEAHLLIQNMNQSPFNVGTVVILSDFTRAEVEQVIQTSHVALSPQQIDRLYDLVAGHPHLLRRALSWIRENPSGRQDSVEMLASAGPREAGLFWDHLWDMLGLLAKEPSLRIILGRMPPGA
jgi:AAA-like domain